jgi:hypothetical protein
MIYLRMVWAHLNTNHGGGARCDRRHDVGTARFKADLRRVKAAVNDWGVLGEALKGRKVELGVGLKAFLVPVMLSV